MNDTTTTQNTGNTAISDAIASAACKPALAAAERRVRLAGRLAAGAARSEAASMDIYSTSPCLRIARR
ncbi:hypothetical protein GCM10010470_38200 [Saccharopolyspora taberi]|uniref:Uncharacterized protein n=1 Tax=Saccharopolyspora taberi TaxID=60895 RepID=A0ABN3VG42_9PSEU